tara:strand:- start:2766 stop:11819 length:9054 start_codon:yes stop_codon:yes gene_type:complete
MANSKTNTSLHIQNDQTNTDGLFQRNNAAELIMQSGGGITEFTNFNDRTNSLRNDGPVPQAFKTSPYYDSADSVFGFPGQWLRLGPDGSYVYPPERNSYLTSRTREKGDVPPHEDVWIPTDDVSFITRTEKSAAKPSDIKILDDIALISYRNHSQEIYLANEEIINAHIIIHSIEYTGHEPKARVFSLASNLQFPEIGTLADNVLEYDGKEMKTRQTLTSSGIYKKHRRAQLAPPTNAGKNCGFRFTVEDDSLATFAPFCFPDKYNTDEDWISGLTEVSFDGDIKLGDTAGHQWLASALSVKAITGHWVTEAAFESKDLDGPSIYFSQDDSTASGGYQFSSTEGMEFAPPSRLNRGFQYFIPNKADVPSEILKPLTGTEGAVLINHEYSMDAPTNYDIKTYKIPIKIKAGSFFYKKGVVNRCGRVDLYERRAGKLSAVNGNRITITGPTGDGTYDTEMLSDGDKIKITSALKDEVTQGIHPINGVKYVKRTALDTEYFIYDDENLSQPTDTSDLRDITSITWTFYEGEQNPNSSWRYKTTLFSPNGLNGSGDADTTPFVVTGESPKLLSKTYRNYDALDLLPEAYRFGQSLDIIKKPGSDHYWLAVGEMGKSYDGFSGISYHQEYHRQQDLKSVRIDVRSGLAEEIMVKPFRSNDPETWTQERTVRRRNAGYHVTFPEHEPYGRVWLYKIDISNDAISTINTPEEINASTTNPYVDPPPFLEGDVDFKKFADYKNLYWHRAMISNFITEGRLGSLFQFEDFYRAGEETQDLGLSGFVYHKRFYNRSSGPLGGRLRTAGANSGSSTLFWRNRGKPIAERLTEYDTNIGVVPKQYINFNVAPIGWLGDLGEFQADPSLEDGNKYNAYSDIAWFTENVYPYYRYNNGAYGDGISITARDWQEIYESGSNDYADEPASTIKPSWMSSGYRFADGFGYNVCLKLDDATGGDKPIMAISNTTVPYLSSISKSVDNQLKELQAKLNKLKKIGYEDPTAQDFIDRHTKTNEFILNFNRDVGNNIDASGELANRYSKGSIFIYNPNQKINTQFIDHTTRLHEDIVSRAFHYRNDKDTTPYKTSTDYRGLQNVPGAPEDPDGYYATNPYIGSENFVDWYGKAPAMFFKEGKLFVGNDNGSVNVYQQADDVSVLNYKQDENSSVNLQPKKLILDRFTTIDGVDRVLEVTKKPGIVTRDASETRNWSWSYSAKIGDPLQVAGYYHFSDFDLKNNDEFMFGYEAAPSYEWYKDTKTNRLTANRQNRDSFTAWKYAIQNWVWKEEDMDTEDVYYPYSVGPDSLVDLDSDETIERSRYFQYTGTTIYPSTVVDSPVYPTNDRSSISDYSFAVQGRSTLNAADYNNVLVREPFGYSFRYDRSILVAHGASYINEFDSESDNLAQRLYLYEVDNKNVATHIQTITPASMTMAENISQNQGELSQINTFADGSITFSEEEAKSITVAYIMSNMYDIMSDRIVLATPYETAIFADSGQTKDMLFEKETFVYDAQPYFSFTEKFAAKNYRNINNFYAYPHSAGIDYPVSVYDMFTSHGGFCAFYNIENSTGFDNSIRRIKSVSITLEVDRNRTQIGVVDGSDGITDDERRIFPSIAFYKDDPRNTIVQKGDTSGDTFEAGPNSILTPEGRQQNVTDKLVLYQKGLQDAHYIQKEVEFVRPDIDTERWVGTVTLTGQEANYVLNTNNLIKDSSDNRTIRNNDGEGNTDGTYEVVFNDKMKPSYDSTINVESTLIMGLLSHSAVFDEDPKVSQTVGDGYPTISELTDGAGYIRWPRGAGTDKIPNGFIPPYFLRTSKHRFDNSVRIKNVEVVYEDVDKGAVRRFQCRSFADNTEAQPITNSFIRLGKSKTPAFFDENPEVLDGTSSDSMQAIKFVGGPSVESGYSISKRFDSFDMQDPQFLSLSITATPGAFGAETLMLQGQLPTTGNMSLHASGISPVARAMPLRMGANNTEQYLGLALPYSFDTDCKSVSLFTPAPYGEPVLSNADLSFAGASGINKGMRLNIGNKIAESRLNFAMGQSVPASGDMSLRISRPLGKYNSIPDIQGNLYMDSTNAASGDVILHIGREATTNTETLFVGSPDPISGVLGLNLNSVPLNSGMDIYTRGNLPDSLTTTLHIGEQVSEAAATLFLMQPHRLPFVDPMSPPVLEPGDSLQIPTLYVSGAAIPSANSLDQNFDHQKAIIASSSIFDKSGSAESEIDFTSSNSISIDKIADYSDSEYGVRRLSRIGSTLEQYTGIQSNTFYENELSRESIGNNDELLVIGSNTGYLSSLACLKIFDAQDSSSVKLQTTYSKFRDDLISIGFLGETESLKLYFKDIKISDKNKIAVAARLLIAEENFYDVVFIIEQLAADNVFITFNDINACALEPSARASASINTITRWRISSVFSSEGWIATEPKNTYIHKIMANSLAWDGEDIYYDQQSTGFASIYKRSESDSYLTASKEISGVALPDIVGYINNQNNLPEATKVGFGAKILVEGDLAFISSPILDPYVSNNSLSGINASSPDGAVHIFKYTSSWDYVDSVYSGGYTSANISGVDVCSYDPKLFGYDIDYSDGHLVVSEPISNTVYQFKISAGGSATFMDSYTGENDAYGTFVNASSRSLITSDREKVFDATFGDTFQYSSLGFNDEVTQYISAADVIDSITQNIYLCRKIKLGSNEGLLIVRDFVVNYGGYETKTIKKFSFVDLQDVNGTLFISGPPLSVATTTLSLHPSGGAVKDMSLHMADVIAYNTGVMTNYIKVAEPASGVSDLHMRGPIARGNPLYMKSDLTDVSSNTDLVVKGPTGNTGSMDVYLEPSFPVTGVTDMFVRGSLAGVEENIKVMGLQIAQVDILNASGVQEIIIDGNTNAAYASGASLYLGAGDFGPSSGIAPIRIEGPSKLSATHTADLAIQTDPPSGVQSGELGLFAYNDQSGIRTRFDRAGVAPLQISSSVFASGILGEDTAAGLVMYRRGVSGGEEVFSTGSLYVTNILDSGNANVYISGANIVTGIAPLVIGSGVGMPTAEVDFSITGYPSG